MIWSAQCRDETRCLLEQTSLTGSFRLTISLVENAIGDFVALVQHASDAAVLTANGREAVVPVRLLALPVTALLHEVARATAFPQAFLNVWTGERHDNENALLAATSGARARRVAGAHLARGLGSHCLLGWLPMGPCHRYADRTSAAHPGTHGSGGTILPEV
jgi:hypothetical protein